jgi:hypothetical protein
MNWILIVLAIFIADISINQLGLNLYLKKWLGIDGHNKHFDCMPCLSFKLIVLFALISWRPLILEIAITYLISKLYEKYAN